MSGSSAVSSCYLIRSNFSDHEYECVTWESFLESFERVLSRIACFGNSVVQRERPAAAVRNSVLIHNQTDERFRLFFELFLRTKTIRGLKIAIWDVQTEDDVPLEASLPESLEKALTGTRKPPTVVEKFSEERQLPWFRLYWR